MPYIAESLGGRRGWWSGWSGQGRKWREGGRRWWVSEEGGRRGSRRVAEEEEEGGRQVERGWRRRRTVGLFGALKMQRNLSLSGGGERAVTARRAG